MAAAADAPGILDVAREAIVEGREREATLLREAADEDAAARAFWEEFETEEAAEKARLQAEEEERAAGLRVTVVQAARQRLRRGRPAFDAATYAPPVHLFVPSEKLEFEGSWSRKLGLGNGAARFLIRNETLNVLRLFADYGPTGDLLDFTVQNRRMFALCMCLLALYLLVPYDGHPSSAIVGIAAQIEQRRDVVPMVLAETIMGLDAVKAGRTDTFAGSPLLLQMWLCDKVGLLREPAGGWVYEPRTWVDRPFVHDEADEDEWTDFFRSLEEDHIAWRCHWLPLLDMTANHMGDTWVILAGLQGYAYYFPQRILRQYCIRQEVEYAVPATFSLPSFKHSVFEHYRTTWRDRVVWAPDPYPTIHLDRHYRDWIRMQIRAQRRRN
ncbi:hypothetical protein Vadar_006040 [Vaccinium darrowii]|uniref:Uncharacterized protein n=1 Tax=Vaccinium darrowii TaxID=229202 RepID=A0ACB7Z990_9ERIC|nr:hypothetical protein Vadar_006040 [Vaccinium darrowii]